MRYSDKPGNPSKSSIRQIKLYSVAVKKALVIKHLQITLYFAAVKTVVALPEDPSP